MALIPCRECDNQVSDAAAYCPSCGIRNPADTTEGLLEANRREVSLGQLVAGTFLGVLVFSILLVLVWFVLYVWGLMADVR